MFCASEVRLLSAWQAACLHHCGVLFLETFSYPLVAPHIFINTSQNAVLLSRDQGFGGEVVDTVVEATLDEFGIHLEAVTVS